MKLKSTKSGRPAAEKGGIRRRYRNLLDPSRFTNPRIRKLKHPVDWYLDGRLTVRPSFGLYTLAIVSEHFLWCAKNVHKRPRAKAPQLQASMEFFAAVRRALLESRHCGSQGKRLSPSCVKRMRKTVKRLCLMGRETYATADCNENAEHVRTLCRWRDSFRDLVYDRRTTETRMV